MGPVLVAVLLAVAAAAFQPRPTPAVSIPTKARRTAGGFHLPIYASRKPRRPHAGRAGRGRDARLVERGSQTGAIGLGDFLDVSYNVMVKVGDVLTPVILDTGSSDLWVMSDACSGNCSQGLPLYPLKSFHDSGSDVQLFYGDSLTGTHAFGPIGTDTTSVASLNQSNQYFAAVNNTNSTVAASGATGIFGLGFPINSFIFSQLFENKFPEAFANDIEIPSDSSSNDLDTRWDDNMLQRRTGGTDYRRTTFPTLPSKINSFATPNKKTKRQSNLPTPDDVLAAFPPFGPLISRLVLAGDLAKPMFTVTLQRDALDVGGNVGLLTVGELPEGVQDSSLTWVPVRGYTPDEGGLSAPSGSPNEVYPMAWEIPIDKIKFDGQDLPGSTLSTDISLSALIDTGNTLLRGPPDVVSNIASKLGGDSSPTGAGTGIFSCSTPHTLSFVIAGKEFPVDPRDFVGQIFVGDVDRCEARLVATDTPSAGKGFLYAWSLGDPFLKSNLVAFYYGNITHPSTDPPRIGFMSTVPNNAGDLLKSAIGKAKTSGGNFPELSQAAPTGTPPTSGTGIGGVGQAVPSGVDIGAAGIAGSKNAALSTRWRASDAGWSTWAWTLSLILCSVLCTLGVL